MTITITHPQSQSHRTRRMIFAAVLTAVAAILVFAVARIMTDDATRPAPDRSAVEATGVTGLSPASATTHPAPSFPDTRGLTEWAEANRMTGLSPASATTHPAPSFPDTRGLTEWAETNRMTGLSPASVARQG